MTFLKLVRERQSIRKYLPKPVPHDVLDRCLEAARLAPSACNSQPWFFIVVDDEKVKGNLAACAFSGIYSLNSFAKNAAALVVVVRECSTYIARLGGYLRGIQYSMIDIGIACEHFILQAQEEGLGTCWLGWFNERAVKKVLGIPKNKRVDVMISLGYPARQEAHDKIRNPLNKIRRFY